MYDLYRSNMAMPESPWIYDVTQVRSGGTVEATWRLRNSEAEDQHRRMVRRGDRVVGHFLTPESGEWLDCGWSQEPPYLPPLRPGAVEAFDTRCDRLLKRGEPSKVHDHMKGEVKVVGTKEATIDGLRRTLWVIERNWRHVSSGDSSGELLVSGTALWSPDLEAMVKQDLHVIYEPNKPTMRQEFDLRIALRGLTGV